MMLHLFQEFKKNYYKDFVTQIVFLVLFHGYLRNLAEYAAFHCLFVNTVASRLMTDED